MRVRMLIPLVLAQLALAVGLAHCQPAPGAAPAAAPAAEAPRVTAFPAGPHPDEVLLTWAGDPRTSMSVQWRTAPDAAGAAVAYLPREKWESFSEHQPMVVQAVTEQLQDPGLANAPFTFWNTARLTKLQPGTEYVYAVGDATAGGWGGLRHFRTAPAGPAPFSFIYMGDAQYGFSRWGALQRAALRSRPDSAFVLMAGDLVTRGNDRDNWDDLLVNGSEVFSQVPVVPAMGNHEYKSDGAPTTYMGTFDLPTNGPEGVETEHCYSFEYGNAMIVVLDSNLPPASQTPWLEQTLSRSQARWKFAMFHHPPYSSDPDRDNKELREAWTPVFDKHHVDIVFNGHDHAYMRTYPMKADRRAGSPAEGTIYLVSVSGTKMYEQLKRDYTEVGFVDTATYSTIDILPATEKAPEKLVYRAFDFEGNVRDQFQIEKADLAPED